MGEEVGGRTGAKDIMVWANEDGLRLVSREPVGDGAIGGDDGDFRVDRLSVGQLQGAMHGGRAIGKGDRRRYAILRRVDDFFERMAFEMASVRGKHISRRLVAANNPAIADQQNCIGTAFKQISQAFRMLLRRIFNQ